MRAQDRQLVPFRGRVLTAIAAALVATVAATFAQVRPAAINELSRNGIQRGTSATITVFGINLGDASAVLFSDPRLTARIVEHVDAGEAKVFQRAGETRAPFHDRARRSELTIEVSAAADAPLGEHAFRLRTPLGTTAARLFEVGELDEVVEAEPNDTSEEPVAALPVTINGEMGWPGDVDRFRIPGRAGTELVLSLEAAGFGSRLDSRLALRDASGRLLAENDDENEATRDALLIHRVASDGPLVVEVTDAAGGGGGNSGYRLSVGALPYVTSVFPLGGRRDLLASLALTGANLGDAARTRVTLTVPERLRPAAAAQPPQEDTVPLELRVNGRALLAEPVLARGQYPEVLEKDTLSGSPAGQPVAVPAIVNGRVSKRPSGPTADTFRIRAAKGQRLVMSVLASRAGSPLDAAIDVLDAQGRPVPRATIRPVWETSVDLRDRGSRDPGLRLLSWSGLERGDYIFVDRELMMVRELPKGPDEDVQLMAFRGRRISYEGTSGESHALTRPVYKVEVHPPGMTFSPNGLPVFTLNYRNDDGGPVYEKDPYLEFQAPAAGEYLVRVSDSRGEASDRHAYRLTIAPPRPDFSLSVAPANPNVPRGSRVPVTVTAFRYDGFDGPIAVELTGLPRGLEASRGVILPGHSTVAMTLAAAADGEAVTAPFGVRGEARIAGRTVTRTADTTRSVPVVSVTAPPPVRVVSVEPALIELAPGQSATVHVKIARGEGFAGRVPLSVLNLPLMVTIPDIGLNGILITEQVDSRSFTITADRKAAPLEQTLFVTARAEVNSAEPVDQASTAITLRVTPKPRSGDVTQTATR